MDAGRGAARKGDMWPSPQNIDEYYALRAFVSFRPRLGMCSVALR